MICKASKDVTSNQGIFQERIPEQRTKVMEMEPRMGRRKVMGMGRETAGGLEEP